ncbi:MAG: HAMP domain-containing sensor histidine kinase [Verrucomicrobiales bacterium]
MKAYERVVAQSGLSSIPPPGKQSDITKSKPVSTHYAVLDGSVLRALADVAIELRGPLSVILGHAENVLQTVDDDDILRSVTAIERSGKRIDRIASDVLTLGALEHEIVQRTAATAAQSFQLKECINDVLDKLAPLIRDRRPALSIQLPAEGCRVPGDYYFWFLAFQHLLENSLGDNPRRMEIAINAERTNGTVVIEFTDKGIGIPPNDLPNIFTPFYRVQRAGNHSHRGVGLGLYFVQRVVTCFGGTITVSSIPSVRTAFTITFT